MKQLYTKLAYELANEMDNNLQKIAADQAKVSLLNQLVDASNGNLPKHQPFYEDSIKWFTTDPYYTKELEKSLEDAGKGNFDGKFYRNPNAIIDAIKAWGYNVAPGKDMRTVQFNEADSLTPTGNPDTEDVPHALREANNGNFRPLKKLDQNLLSTYFSANSQEAVTLLMKLLNKSS